MKFFLSDYQRLTKFFSFSLFFGAKNKRKKTPFCKKNGVRLKRTPKKTTKLKQN